MYWPNDIFHHRLENFVSEKPNTTKSKQVEDRQGSVWEIRDKIRLSEKSNKEANLKLILCLIIVLQSGKRKKKKERWISCIFL